MYIRWKQRARSQDGALVAHLAHSRRIAGQPRQQVRYLASIRVAYQAHPAHRHLFWERVEARLAPLALAPAQRQALEQQLAQRVPRPTADECQQVATLRSHLQGLALQMGTGTPV